MLGERPMLRALDIANFKAIARRQHVRLAPLTLIFGANSSGKTSLLQSLLLLQQSADTEDPVAALTPKGPLLDLGGFREFVHGHDLEREVAIALEVDPIVDGERLVASGPTPRHSTV